MKVLLGNFVMVEPIKEKENNSFLLEVLPGALNKSERTKAQPLNQKGKIIQVGTKSERSVGDEVIYRSHSIQFYEDFHLIPEGAILYP